MSAVKQIISAAVVAVPFAFGATMALAAPPEIVVNTTDGTVAGTADGWCSLPEAIQNANAGAQANPDCDRPKGRFARIDLTNPGGPLISLDGVIKVTAPVKITGPGSSALEIKQTVAARHFRVDTTMTLTGVRLTGAGVGGSVTVRDWGAGLGSPRSLALRDVVFSGNEGGGIDGGAVTLDDGASATIYDCKFFNNENTVGSGGAIWLEEGSTATIGNSVFIGNMAAGHGGAIYALQASLTVMDSVFAGNDAGASGGAIANLSGDGSGDATISNSTIIGNLATGLGGGVYYQLARRLTHFGD